MSDGATSTTFHENKLSLITFNYDRSLEFYLHRAIKRLWDLDDNEAAEVLKAVPIIHIHGKIDALP
ncbi:MAG: hypothetical protein ACREIG_07135, partial [Nitrospiraceae bacterium]